MVEVYFSHNKMEPIPIGDSVSGLPGLEPEPPPREARALTTALH